MRDDEPTGRDIQLRGNLTIGGDIPLHQQWKIILYGFIRIICTHLSFSIWCVILYWRFNIYIFFLCVI